MKSSKFVERLKELMEEREITPSQLNEALKLGNSTVNHYLTGRFLPTIEIFVKLCDYFCCTTDYLYGTEEESAAKRFRTCPPFGERLPIVCKEKRKSRYLLCKQTGIAESTMRYWVRGRTSPSVVNVAKIAETLGVSMDYLLGREE